MRIALYKGRGRIGNAITRWWTGCIYSHCELVIDGLCYSASFMDGGVRKKDIDLATGRWDIVEVPWADKTYALEFFARTIGAKYDWLGLFGAQMFNRRIHSEQRWFCSEWIGGAMRLPHPETRSPSTLVELIYFLNKEM